MSSSFEVVTDVGQIAKLNKRLAQELARTFKFKETREITYPSDHHTGTVYFESRSGGDIRGWAPHTQNDKLLNFLLVGEPGATKWMEITVQLNFPAGKYNRRMAGAFVKDENGHVFVAHRGKLTKGHAGLQKDKVFREFAPQTIEAVDVGKTSRLILLSALDDPNLADRLWTFAEEAREVATRLAHETDLSIDANTLPSGGASGTPRSRAKKSPLKAKERMLKLRAYFDEHAGEGFAKGYGGGKRTVEHGDVVRALEALMRANGISQKAQAIDLAIVTPDKVDLFEVKTSTKTTDVYTGVGQLLIHGESIVERLDLPVRRHLVLPERPSETHARHITNKGGIGIVTFVKDGKTYKFEGIE